MSINLVVLDGVVKSMALRFDTNAKPELRFTLAATDHATDGKPWVSYWPCCAAGTAATRLAEALEDGQHIVVSSGKLCYRKRATKSGEQSRIEILVWQVDVLTTIPADEKSPGYEPRLTPPESASGLDESACNLEPASVPEPKKARKPSRTRASMLAWAPGTGN